jgi:outer membrane protein assembly factor BamA
LKKNFFIFLFILCNQFFFGQNFYLKITSEKENELKKIDSIGYKTKHSSVKNILDENFLFTKKLTQLGFYDSQELENKKENDSVFRFQYSIGKQTKSIHIYIGKKNDFSELLPDENPIIIPVTESEAFLNSIIKKLETKGYSTSKVSLENIERKNNFIKANLKIDTGKKRQVNNIVINGVDKFPESHKKNLIRLYKNKVFNQQTLEKLHNDIEKYRFVKQTKYPEILFTQDSTKIYVYLEKAKANSFDGYIGFTNDEQDKVVFSGYVDLILNNVLNSGEKLSLFWKSDGQEQRTFNLGAEIPYIFKSPFGIKTNLNIFKQDSTFQNTRTALDLGYYFNYTTKAYIGYQSNESSDIQNANTFSLSDFESTFYTTGFEYTNFKIDDFLFPENTHFEIKFGTGKRESNIENTNQFFGNLLFRHNLYLNDKNVINIKSQNFYLQSNTYLVNELFRFGGINSIRGFNENSLQGNLLTSILTEYRYVLSPNLYAHSIIDYGYFKDNTSNTSDSLLGLGFGIGLQTKNGLFNLVYANGSTKEQNAKLSNSIVHVSLKANF